MSRYRECDHDEGPGHDCQYVDERNRLIPRAWQEAEALVKNDNGPREAMVAREFFAAMNRLAGTPNAARPEPVNGFNHHRRYVA